MNHQWLCSLQKDSWGILLVIEDGGGGWTQPMLLSCQHAVKFTEFPQLMLLLIWVGSRRMGDYQYAIGNRTMVRNGMTIYPWVLMIIIDTVIRCPEMGGLLTRLTVCCLQSSCSGQWWLLNLYSGWCRMMALSSPYCIDGSSWLYRCINYQFHLIRRCSNLVGVCPEQPLLYCCGYYLLIIMHQRPPGGVSRTQRHCPIPHSRYMSFNMVMVCINNPVVILQ